MKLKKIMTIVTLLFSSIFLCSCSFNNDLKDHFISYYDAQLNEHAFKTSVGTEMVIINLDKENISDSPKIVLTVHVGRGADENETYQWLKLSLDERKANLKECADLVIEYAKNNNWENDYYLYVNVCQVYGGCSIIYDYEEDEIWIPNCENTFIEMYEKFNTFYKKDLEETQEGIDFLVDNNLAYMKHNQVEYKNIFFYNIYIDNDGNFKSYGEDDSTKY